MTQDWMEQAVAFFRENRDEAVRLTESRLRIRGGIQQIRIREAQEQRNLGNYARADQILSLAILDAGGGALLGELYHHRGTNAQNEGSYERALKFLYIALQVRKDAGDMLGAAYSAFQVPMCRKVSGVSDQELIPEFQLAKDTIMDALANPSLSFSHQGNLRQNLAFCLQVESDFAKALEEYRTVLRFREKAEANKELLERRETALTWARMSECMMELRAFNEATALGLQALAVFQHVGDVNRIKQAKATLEQIAVRQQS